jgi:predicted permease
LRRFFRRGRWDDERRLEIETHLAIEIDENLARGMPPSEARWAAQRKFGNATRIREEIFRMNTIGILDALWRDLRHAARLLQLNPAFSSVAVLSLALGIGVNTAVFSLVNEVLLRSLSVKNPGELVLFRAVEGVGGRLSRAGENNGSIDAATGRNSSTSFSLLIFERFRSHPSALSDVFAFAPVSQPNVLIDGQPELAASVQLVSGSYHGGLGVPARLGRVFTEEDDQSSVPPVAVISYRYWDARFGRDPGVIGKTIAVNRVSTSIVGVTPPGFDGTAQAGESSDISLILAHHLLYQPARIERMQPWYWWLRVMGRVAPGATAAQARASLEPIFQAAAREGWVEGRSRDLTPRAMPGDSTLAADPGAQGENNTRRQYAKSLYLLMGLVGLVLLAACANVANLLLARGAARRREIALRLALGAGRGRVVAQLLTESLLLAGVGALLGTLLAWRGRGLLLALRPFGATMAVLVLDLPLDVRVLTFTTLAAVLTALLFGLAPALRVTRVDLAAEFQGGVRSLGGRGRSRLSQTLMVVQIALSLVLLVSTGLFVRTLRNLEQVDVGFNHRGLVLFQVEANSAGYPREQFAALHARLRDRLERVPGVRSATFSRIAVLSRVRQNNTITVTGSPPPPDATAVNMNGLAANFFSAMQLPIVLGRGFAERDDVAAPKVAVVNQALVRKYFGHESPLGRQIVYTVGPFNKAAVEVVGVAADAKYTDLRTPIPPTLYVPALQQVGGEANFALRLDGDAAAVFPAIRAAVREIDPTLPVLNLRTQDEQLDRLNGQELLFARLSGLFGLLALALAGVGLYGLMSYSVLRRTAEIGLRIALGAVPAHVLRMMLRESLTLGCAGVVVGVAAAAGLSGLVKSMLFGLSPTDPLTYAVVAALLLGAALLASYLPARRASRLEPTEALRQE